MKTRSCQPRWFMHVALGLWSACAGFELPHKLVVDLQAADFTKRETAQAALYQWGKDGAEPAMRQMLALSKSAEDPEVRARSLDALRDLVIDRYQREGEGYLGIGLRDEVAMVPGDDKERSVIRISEVMPGTPAAKAGILGGDLIVSLDGASWRNADATPAFREKIKTLKPETKVVLGILRDGKVTPFEVTLMRRPVAAEGAFVMGGNLMFNDRDFNPEAMERAAKETYFRKWCADRNPPEGLGSK